jgi:hypothetical protein
MCTKIKFNSKILILIFIIGISGCSSSFIVQTKSKTIVLSPIPKKAIKVVVDNGNFQMRFDRNSLINLFEKDLKEWPDPRFESYINDLKSLKSDKIFKKEKTIMTLPLVEFELKFHALLLNGEAEIINNKNQEKIQRIKYKFTKDRLGGENAYFYTENGIEIYSIVLAFGE